MLLSATHQEFHCQPPATHLTLASTFMRWRDSCWARTAALCRKAGCGTRLSSGDIRQLTRGQDSACSVATACCSVCGRRATGSKGSALSTLGSRLQVTPTQSDKSFSEATGSLRAHLHGCLGVRHFHGQRNELGVCGQRGRGARAESKGGLAAALPNRAMRAAWGEAQGWSRQPHVQTPRQTSSQSVPMTRNARGVSGSEGRKGCAKGSNTSNMT